MASTDRFGYEWAKYDQILPAHEGQFLMWVTPLTAVDFKNKRVLDAGCGMGRNSYWACHYGAREVVAFDYDKRSVTAALKTLAKFPQASVRYESIYDINYQNEFDIVFSIGVIHHLVDPEKAILNLYRALCPGGRLLLWVYGDMHKHKIRLINLVRLVLSRMPVALVHFLTYFISVPFYLYLKVFPQRSDYLKLLKTFSFLHVHAIAFDQLIPQVAHYWSRAEIEVLLRVLPPEHESLISPIRGYSWSVLITKPL
ncbi:MAG: hypothetical protein A2571_01435 [Candidatus Vogelbacteria bacterium RIFOXYD1_FULL_44_32]|uniref:Methyltransferase type 11 domain-containing protein n=1 Tax=Candidatus Vogelbacteria bacterium RIFOXYD1_FULL_44_32 TaxID=1802438 RepID=A0A1G2QCW4_9BACT|nr:MAG: hypothetical protein A2571_01435 [Candidatus Vogelbacteria bacterium RIFOXYD1_FULL_44_32]